jgi:hypothetical protein
MASFGLSNSEVPNYHDDSCHVRSCRKVTNRIVHVFRHLTVYLCSIYLLFIYGMYDPMAIRNAIKVRLCVII